MLTGHSIYLADDTRVRRVVPGDNDVVDGGAGEIITTVAGVSGGGPTSGGAPPPNGDGEAATKAQLNHVRGIAIARSGALYISAFNRIRRVSPGVDGTIDGGEGETITRVAGGSVAGFSGDGGPPLQAQFSGIGRLDVDEGGSVYLADTSNQRIRRFGPDVLAVSTSESFDPGAAGGPFTYSLSVTNYSSAPANAVVLTNTLDPRVVFRSATSSEGRCKAAGATVSCELRRLDAGKSAAVAITVVAPAQSTMLRNRATVVAKEADPFPLNNVSIEPTTVLPEANLSVGMTESADPVAAGASLAYTMVVTNAGPGAATAVALTDTLPPQTSVRAVSATQGSCRAAKDTLTCDLGNLAPDGTATVVLDLGTPAQPALLVNTAAVRAYEADLTPAAATAHTVVTAGGGQGVGVALADSPDPVRVGSGNITYTLTAAYAGPGRATGTVVTDTLAPELSFVSARASQGTCTHSAGTVSCTLGTLGPDAPVTVTIVAAPKAPGDLANAATVRAEGLEAAAALATTRVSHPNCGKAVSKNTKLRADIGPCAGAGVIVTHDGITLDLAGYHIFGFEGPGDGNAAGVLLPGRTGVTIHNTSAQESSVSHFDAGMLILGGGANTVSRLTIADNVGPDDVYTAFLGDGIALIDSVGNRIKGNRILRNGIFDGIGVLGPDADGNIIDGNIIAGTLGPSDSFQSSGQGIYTNSAAFGPVDGRTVTGTLIAGNTVQDNASGGIANLGNTDGKIVGNSVIGNGKTNNAGNGIGLQIGPAANGAGARMLVERNEVHGNTQNGIAVSMSAGGNTIQDNNAANNALEDGFFDLIDEHPTCGDNIWLRNTWGDGFFIPPCTGAFGTGPVPTTTSTDATGVPQVTPPVRLGPQTFSFVMPKEEIT